VESGWYQGYQYFGGGAPFSGGICLILAMNILERYDIPALNRSTLAYHWLAEALAFTFSDRLALGDPQFVNLTDILPPMVIQYFLGLKSNSYYSEAKSMRRYCVTD